MNRFSLVKSLLKEFAGEQEIRPDSSLQGLAWTHMTGWISF
jgi:hypothetical protein